MPEESIIKLKRTHVSGKVPALSSLELGELALNTTDGKIFFKNSNNEILTFLNESHNPYTFNRELSSVTFQGSYNNANEILATVLGGVDNNVTGAASTVINGESNDVNSNFSVIGNGLNNKILSGGDYSFIGSGENNLISHQNVFTLGSNLSSHAENFTYVNNISATGKIYGDGSELTGIIGGTSGEYLPLSGGNLTGAFSTTSTISSSQTILASGARVITGLPNDETPVYFMTVLPQSAYDALGTKNPNTIYFISNP